MPTASLSCCGYAGICSICPEGHCDGALSILMHIAPPSGGVFLAVPLRLPAHLHTVLFSFSPVCLSLPSSEPIYLCIERSVIAILVPEEGTIFLCVFSGEEFCGALMCSPASFCLKWRYSYTLITLVLITSPQWSGCCRKDLQWWSHWRLIL